MKIVIKSILLVIYLVVLKPVDGCGQLQPGRAVMAYAENPTERMKVANLSATTNDVQTFVQRLIMAHVDDVLYEQGRSAFLSDNVISSILQQLDVQISYDPLKCEQVITNPMMGINAGGTMVNCVIINGAVANICKGTMNDSCNMQKIGMNYKAIDPKHFIIFGSLKTSNAIMASWSNQMWGSVLNRVLRRIASGQYASYFFGASVNIR